MGLGEWRVALFEEGVLEVLQPGALRTPLGDLQQPPVQLGAFRGRGDGQPVAQILALLPMLPGRLKRI